MFLESLSVDNYSPNFTKNQIFYSPKYFYILLNQPLYLIRFNINSFRQEKKINLEEFELNHNLISDSRLECSGSKLFLILKKKQTIFFINKDFNFHTKVVIPVYIRNCLISGGLLIHLSSKRNLKLIDLIRFFKDGSNFFLFLEKEYLNDSSEDNNDDAQNDIEEIEDLGSYKKKRYHVENDYIKLDDENDDHNLLDCSQVTNDDEYYSTQKIFFYDEESDNFNNMTSSKKKNFSISLKKNSKIKEIKSERINISKNQKSLINHKIPENIENLLDYHKIKIFEIQSNENIFNRIIDIHFQNDQIDIFLKNENFKSVEISFMHANIIKKNEILCEINPKLISQYNYQMLRLNKKTFHFQMNQVSSDSNLLKSFHNNYYGYNYYLFANIRSLNKLKKEDHNLLISSRNFSQILENSVFNNSISNNDAKHQQFNSTTNKETIDLITNDDVNLYDSIFFKSNSFIKKIYQKVWSKIPIFSSQKSSHCKGTK